MRIIVLIVMAFALFFTPAAHAGTLTVDLAPSRPQVPLAGEVEQRAIPRSLFHEKARPVITPEMLLTAGYLTSQDRPFGRIIDFERDSDSVTLGDIVFVNKGSKSGVKKGDLFYTYGRSSAVEDPDSGEAAGYIVSVSGVVEITAVKEDISTAKVVTAYDAIFKEQSITPKYAVVPPKMDPDRPLEEKEIKGKIVHVHYGKGGISQFDIVYIDAGSAASVKAGDIFAITEYKPPKSDEEPSPVEKRIGSAQVILIGDAASTAIVLDSTSEIKAGDRVAYVQER